MRFLCLAADYDGTLAKDGTATPEVWNALRRLRESGRKLVLVTGRDFDDLRQIASPLDRFDAVVAENGGVLFLPATNERRTLAPPPPPELIDALRRRGVAHLGVSRTLAATVKPYETIALEVIRDLGLELKLVFNKDAVMIVAPGVTKATGLVAALDELKLSPRNVVAVGDAENDHAFLDLCECPVAVANALPMVKKNAAFVTASEDGHGVVELIDELLGDDLSSRHGQLKRNYLMLGWCNDRSPKQGVSLAAFGTRAMIAGPSGGGKSSVTVALLERLAAAGRQFCVLDPEGDYHGVKDAVALGDSEHSPTYEQVLQVLEQPRQNAIVNLLRTPFADRPIFCAGLLSRLHELRTRTGRPHWLVLDEAHHLFPAAWEPADEAQPRHFETMLLVTVNPAQVSSALLQRVNLVLAVGDAPQQTLAEFARCTGQTPPAVVKSKLEKDEALVWRPRSGSAAPMVVAIAPGRTERRRHSRKYAEGMLIPERSFYFRGPAEKLNLRAHNLIMFVELAAGVDDETWLHHLHRRDYSDWFAKVIGDEELAHEADEIASDEELSPAESRGRLAAAIGRRYTLPENLSRST